MLSAFREEAAITKRVLERVAVDKLSWGPHPKSMSLGQLALHLAGIPGNLAKLVELEEFDATKPTSIPSFRPISRKSLSAFEQSIRAAEELS
jgi:hypothetical protein